MKRFPLTLSVLGLLLAGCPGSGAGMINREVLRPSVDAVTFRFDDLIEDAVSRGEMHPVEGNTWRGESALLRHLVSGSTEPVAAPAPLGAPDSPE